MSAHCRCTLYSVLVCYGVKSLLLLCVEHVGKGKRCEGFTAKKHLQRVVSHVYGKFNTPLAVIGGLIGLSQFYHYVLCQRSFLEVT